ncbi:MAG: alpha/beta hydrolase [Rickettsiales bacterium]|jgi:dipeptidyl aminopeptidase/acylaminoacyl peptidase|nr:alpha/beta hydrolase [Rickettsiales bacterium]
MIAKNFRLILAGALAAGATLAYSTAVFLVQDMLLFKPGKKNPAGAAEYSFPEFREVFIETADRLRLRARYYAGDKSRPAILYNHGQSYDIDKLAFVMKPYIEEGFPVYMTGYRAYGGNPGKYSEAGFVLDIGAGWNFLRAHGHDKIIVHGFSMGCAHSASFAANEKPHALILESSFAKLSEKVPTPARPLIKYKMDVEERARTITAPALVLHGGNDKKVPIAQGRKVFDALPGGNKEFMEIPDAGHYTYNNGSITKIIDWLRGRGLDRG